MNCRITHRLLLAVVAMTVMTLYVQACPYHDRLRELARQQRERMAELRRRQSLHDARQSAIHQVRQNLGGSRSSHSHNHASHGHRPAPRPAPVAGGTRHITQVRRPVSSSRTHRYYPQSQVNGHTDQIVNSYYVQPEQHVPCPGSNIYYCPIGTYCKHQRGSSTPYRCMYQRTVYSCNPGFKQVSLSSTQFMCQDINECENATLNTCEQECINTRGSYRCLCEPGFEAGLTGSCEDVDECSSNICDYQCENSIGNYTCSCPTGYKKSGDRCFDIDECAGENNCLETERCLNMFGGFECQVSEECEEGYHRTSGDAFGPCVIINYDRYNYTVPVSIAKNRYGLRSTYPAGSTVGRMNFGVRIHTFEIIEGNEFFRVYTNPRRYVLHIKTKVPLEGAGNEYVLRLDVVHYSSGIPMKSRVQFEFVLSEYNF